MTEFFMIDDVATPDGDLPFHSLEYDGGRQETVWVDTCDRVAEVWRPLPCTVQRYSEMPHVFTVGTRSRVAFPEAVNDELSRRFPDHFEWLPLEIIGEITGDFGVSAVTELSKQVAGLRLHIMHCIRPVRLSGGSKVVEFAPSSKKMEEIPAFADVETYAFRQSTVRGMHVLFVEQDLTLLCTDDFRRALHELGLVGVSFVPVRVVME